jgi:Cyclic nucleotide-binding domain
MSGAPHPSPGIPPPLDGDDDDVAWALQTAAVQWKRGAHADAIVWLRRAVDAAIQAGQGPRASELNGAAADLTEQMLAHAAPVSEAAPSESMSSIDALLEGAPPKVARAPMPTSVEVDLGEMEPGQASGALTQPSPPPSEPPAIPETPPPPEALAAPAAPPPVPAVAPPPRHASPPPPPPRPASAAPLPRHASPPPPPAPSEPAPAESGAREALAFAREAAEPPSGDRPTVISVAGVALGEVRGLEDLPEEAQVELAARARLQTLAPEEETGAFAIALVVKGWVNIMPTIADAVCARAAQGEVVFTQGTLEEGVLLRVVAGEEDTTLALWDRAAMEKATADCPWVADELRAVADRYQALAGAAMGPLGERLDDALRAQITDRCEVRALLPREFVFSTGQPVAGIHIVGAGRIEVIEGDSDAVADELGPGDILFSNQVMASAPAPATARAGKDGALLLCADRHVAHELMVSVPPLLELLAS